MTKMPLAEVTAWSRHSRRIDPVSLSASPFCQDHLAETGRSRMPLGCKVPNEDAAMGAIGITNDILSVQP